MLQNSPTHSLLLTSAADESEFFVLFLITRLARGMLLSYFSLLVAHYLLGNICYNQGLLRLVMLFFEKRKKKSV
jgi:hypothetical protein